MLCLVDRLATLSDSGNLLDLESTVLACLILKQRVGQITMLWRGRHKGPACLQLPGPGTIVLASTPIPEPWQQLQHSAEQALELVVHTSSSAGTPTQSKGWTAAGHSKCCNRECTAALGWRRKRDGVGCCCLACTVLAFPGQRGDGVSGRPIATRPLPAGRPPSEAAGPFAQATDTAALIGAHHRIWRRPYPRLVLGGSRSPFVCGS